MSASVSTAGDPATDDPEDPLDPVALAAVSDRLERRPATDAIRWARDRFGDDLVAAVSFQDALLVDLIARVDPAIEVVFLDTKHHFAETLAYVEQVRRRYDLNLRVMEPLVALDDLWRTDPGECCAMRKVEPLARALRGKRAWMSGLRRVEAPTRADAPVVGPDVGRGIVKVNPVAAWSDDDVEQWVRDHGLPVHPLRGQGYPSVGCAPCTRPVAPGEDPRAGRWSGTGRIECGLHGWS